MKLFFCRSKMNQNQKWPYVGDVTFQHTSNQNKNLTSSYFDQISGQKHALSLERSPVHVAWSGVIGKMLAGPRTQNLMSAQGDDDDYDEEEDDDEGVNNDDDEEKEIESELFA